MRNKEKDAYEMAIKRQTILEKSFQLFSSEGIEPVSYLITARSQSWLSPLPPGSGSSSRKRIKSEDRT